jgi:hypothetical protein
MSSSAVAHKRLAPARAGATAMQYIVENSPDTREIYATHGRRSGGGHAGFLAPPEGEGDTAMRKPDLGPVRESLHKLRLEVGGPHPDLRHSPSYTGVNALMACGEKE